jgi:hypothetical protein
LIAERYFGRGVIGIEELGPHVVHDWTGIRGPKEDLASSLDAYGPIQHDADEFRVCRGGGCAGVGSKRRIRTR